MQVSVLEITSGVCLEQLPQQLLRAVGIGGRVICLVRAALPVGMATWARV
jgi:hypothetical protein